MAPSHDPWMTAMRRGDFAAAWEISDRVLAERCSRGEGCSHWPRHLQYIWDGSSFDDKHVLVRCYHGLGDSIQFVRFMELLRQRARKITLWAQPSLLHLLSHVRGIDALVPLREGEPDLAYDTDIELMEVPHALRVTRGDLLPRMPYIELPRSASRMERRSFNVGLTWRSGEWDPSRSLSAEALEPLRSISGVSLYSLQYPPAPLPFPAHDLACRDIYMMAKRMLELDLVISVDTMVAHLAGALALPVWLLLNERPDWRWLDAGDTSPWYPTMRVFRRRDTDWRALVVEVAGALGVAGAARDRATTAARCIRSSGYRASSG